jgi:hypothetical protein
MRSLHLTSGHTVLLACAALLAAACSHTRPPTSAAGPSPSAHGLKPFATTTPSLPIAPGETRTGALTLTSPQFSDGSRYALYTFSAAVGDTVTAKLSSDDFDPFVIVADVHGNSLKRDDDGGGQCNAQLWFVPATAGTYRLYVNSSAKAELGAFQLSLARGALPGPADSGCTGYGRVAGLTHVGDTVTDSLTADDPMFVSDSTYFQRWILPAQAGRTFTIDLSSRDFDAYLMVAHGRGERLAYDDDSGPGCDARLVYTPTDDRPLRIIANTSSRPKRQTGAFTLRITDGPSPVDSSRDCQGHADPARTLRIGQRVEGRLTDQDMIFQSDSTYAQIWTLEGVAGDTVTIDLISDDFDAYLMVSGPGLQRDRQDDDSGGFCNARVTLTFPQTGTYQVVANTAEKHATGRYRLEVAAGTAPTADDGGVGCQRQ